MNQFVRDVMLAISFTAMFASLRNRGFADEKADLIGALEQAFQPVTTVAASTQFTSFTKGGIHKEEVKVGSGTTTVLRDGDRWSVLGEHSAIRYSPTGSKEHTAHFEFLSSGDCVAKVGWMGVTKSRKPHSFTATFEEKVRRDEPGVITLYNAFVWFGFCPDQFNKQLIQVVKDANTAGQLNVVSQGSNPVLEIRNEFGLQSIVFTRINTRLLPVWVNTVKGSSDIMGGKKVGDWKGGRDDPEGTMMTCEQHIGPIIWDSDQKYIKTYEIHSVFAYQGGNVETRSVCTALSAHALSEKELRKFVIQSPIPDGTPVNIREMLQIAHEWRDGKIQKVVDLSAVEKLNDTRFQQPSPPLFTLSRVVIGLSILVGVFGGGWLIYQRVRTRE